MPDKIVKPDGGRRDELTLEPSDILGAKQTKRPTGLH